jgi:hypothetical protein
MTLAPETRLGPYAILSLIGAGGMGACGHGERAAGAPNAVAALGWPMRVEPSRRGGGAPRQFLKQTDLAHAGVSRWH